ncbi:hypothetical protein bcere0028_22290 [Bacillus cereus AH1271]|nr:hypothetical protein bcere0028_22290 [Bacillus cereus AH1271]
MGISKIGYSRSGLQCNQDYKMYSHFKDLLQTTLFKEGVE